MKTRGCSFCLEDRRLFFELVTVFHDKVSGNIYQLLRVAVCLLYTHYLGFTEIVRKLGKQGNVAAGEAVNRLPVITNAQEFCIRLIDDCLYQIEAGYGNVLVLVNYHPFIRMNSVAFTNELSCLVNHIREINVAFRFEVFVISNDYRLDNP